MPNNVSKALVLALQEVTQKIISDNVLLNSCQ